MDNSILAVNMTLQGREALLAFQKSVLDLQSHPGVIKCDPRNIHRLNIHVDRELGRDGRIRLYSWLVGREIKTTTDLTEKEAAGMLRFAQPEKVGVKQYDYTHEFKLAVQAIKETSNVT